MSGPTDRSDLFQLCLQDLHAGRQIAGRDLGRVVASAGSNLAPQVRAIRERFIHEQRIFERLADDVSGPENLWMRGILDDALRDTQTISRGDLLDAAIIGAVRKALAADGVSLDTALVLARELGLAEADYALLAMRQHNREADAGLLHLLATGT